MQVDLKKADDQQQKLQETSSSTNASSDEPSPDNQVFECNICLDTAKDAVVSMCGHLFCWPCLHQWLSTADGTQNRSCPVCKAAISRDKVIPIYGRGGDDTNRQDPRDKLPPRPPGQRTEPPDMGGYNGPWGTFGGVNGGPFFGFGDGGFHMSFGIGTFPHNIFAPLASVWQDYSNHQIPRHGDFWREHFFLLLGFAFITWLIMIF